MVSGIVILGIGILAVSFLINRSFEEMFPKEVRAGIVKPVFGIADTASAVIIRIQRTDTMW